MNKKTLFLRTYANLPLESRKEPIVVLNDGEPLTWNAAWIEIENDTEKANSILDFLFASGILKEQDASK